MKVSIISLMLVVLVSTTYARSLTPNDVPDPPMKAAARLPHVRPQFSPKGRGPARNQRKNKALVTNLTKVSARSSHTSDIKASQQPVFKASYQPAVKVSDHPALKASHKSVVKVSHQPAVKVSYQPLSKSAHQPIVKVPLHAQAKSKNAVLTQAHTDARRKSEPRDHLPARLSATSHSLTNGKDRVPPPAFPKTDIIFNKPEFNEGNATTATPTPTLVTTSTTLDPWEEFCKEACAAGMAGAECDCAGHPIGRRNAPPMYPYFTSNEDETVLQ